MREGWAANIEVGGPRYRRSRLCEPSPATSQFSITAVYMNSTGTEQRNPEGGFRGDYTLIRTVNSTWSCR